jgi:uncharacterized phage protein (TIGR02218 family)
MRTLTTEAEAALLSGHKCWNLLLTLRDGTQRGYTSAAESFAIQGVTYQPQNGITPAQYRSDLKPEPSSSEFQGFFSDDQISDIDLLSGALDGAIATLFICSYQEPPSTVTQDECLILSVGELGKATSTNRSFSIEFLTSEVKFSQSLRKRTQSSCRNTLGDSRCQVQLPAYQFLGEVVTITENRDITYLVISQETNAEPNTDDFYRNGRITFTTGANAGNASKIRAHSSGNIQLLNRPFALLAVGDRFTATVGCNKTLAECNTKFNNSNQFRGEPFVPGPNSLIRSPQQ